MPKLKIGQKIIWNGQETKQGERAWLIRGTIGKVAKYHPEIKGTGKTLDYNIDGTPIIDRGIKAWYTLDFGNAGQRACEPSDVGKTVLLI